MTKEQKAIEIIDKMIKSYIEADECGLSNNDFKHEIKAMQTVLNMLKEKDKEIEKLKKQSRNLDKEAQAYLEELVGDKGMKERVIKQLQVEIEKKNKQIDLMAETIFDDTIKLKTFWCNGCTEIKECPYEEPKKCIKQYFERRIEKSRYGRFG